MTEVWLRSSFCRAKMTTKIRKNLRAAMREALRIQGRFAAEPLFAKTGKGYLKSEDVSTLQRIKSRAGGQGSKPNVPV